MIDQITITSKRRGEITLTRGDRVGIYLDDVDFGKVEGNHNLYNYYNQVGASIASTVIGTRDISITGHVLEDWQDTMRERYDLIERFFNPTEDLTIHFRGYKIDFRPDMSVGWERDHKANNRYGRKFLVQGTAAFPLFAEEEQTQVTFDTQEKLFRFPTSFGSDTPFAFAVTSETYGTTVNNNGDTATGVTCQISFTASVTNPRIVNRTTGKFVAVNRTFVGGETLEICTSEGNKYMRVTDSNGATVSVMRYRHVNNSWWKLQPGENAVSVTCDDVTEIGGMSVTLFYTPLYMEVE